MSVDDERATRFEDWAITRRDALRGALAGGVLVTAGGVLAACGSEDVDVPTSDFGATSLEGVRDGGTLRVGVAGGGADDSIDAHVLATVPDISRAFQLYEPLAGRDTNSDFELVLAESIEPEKGARTWTIRLRPGVTFHNGKPVTADDVLFSLQRIIDPKDPKTGAASISYMDLKQSRKLDDRTVRIQLKFPNVGFPDDLGQYFNSIVPTDYDPAKPVGTGPFMYDSFVPGERSEFKKNPDYWRDDMPRADEVVIIDFPDDTPRVNALLSGQVDAITNLPPGQIAQVKSNDQFKVLISETGGWQPFTMRVDQEPFKDVRVRQAMRLLVDREQMIEQVLSGQGRVANDLYSPYDPAYNSDLPQRRQDLDQAKSLLRRAGQSDLSVELVTSPVFQGIVEAAQVIAEQAKGAGVSIKRAQGGPRDLLRRQLPVLGLRPGLLGHPVIPEPGRAGQPAGLPVQRDALGRPRVPRPDRTGAGGARRGQAHRVAQGGAGDRVRAGWPDRLVVQQPDRCLQHNGRRVPAREVGLPADQLRLRKGGFPWLGSSCAGWPKASSRCS